VLHESREPYPCHTFRSDAAEIFTPPRSLKATHAQRCNSCRSGACPNVQIPYPCRLHRRQGPLERKKNANNCAARKWARPPCKTLCQPAARRSAHDAGMQTTKSRQREGRGIRRPGATPPAPAPIYSKSYYNSSILHPARTQRATHAGPHDGGGGLPLPAAASAAP